MLTSPNQATATVGGRRWGMLVMFMMLGTLGMLGMPRRVLIPTRSGPGVRAAGRARTARQVLRRVLESGCAGALLIAALGAGATPVAASGCAPPEWVVPVEGTVVDGFRPPVHIGAPGNRGWEYRTLDGAEVRAVGTGVVTFAGTIGFAQYVAVTHCDRTRTTYSFLATVEVRRGDLVVVGQRLGSSDGRVHFGVRRDGRYVDPAALLGSADVSRLVRLARLVGRWRSHW